MADQPILSPSEMQHLRLTRGNMLPSLSGAMLARALDAFETGNLREASLLWQTMCSRDDILSVVKPKREKAVSRRDWTVLVADDSRNAKRQKEVLTDFWNSVRCVNAYDRNQKGALPLLVRQMMEAQSYRYAAHHIQWRPTARGLRATFEYVPLNFFENRTGTLRFVRNGIGISGEELVPNEWMVTVGDGLMQAGSIGYFCKSRALQDWIIFSQDFGQPKVVGRTAQAEDSPGGVAMANAVAAFGNDWRSVIFGDDGTGKIELLTVNGSASVLPMPALIERVDRRLTAMWRGADLSTMSSNEGQGTGASLQDGETDILEFDDALTISETLNEAERTVLAYHFGADVEPLAYIRLLVPQREDLKLLLEVVTRLVALGAPFAIAEVLERFGWSMPKDKEQLLGKPKAEPTTLDAVTQLNASKDNAEEKFLAGASRLLGKAGAEDRATLVVQLKEVLSAPKGQELNALKGFVERLPEQVGKDAAQVAAWEQLLMASLVNGLGAE